MIEIPDFLTYQIPKDDMYTEEADININRVYKQARERYLEVYTRYTRKDLAFEAATSVIIGGLQGSLVAKCYFHSVREKHEK